MAAAVIAARGQTQIDLRTQGKNIDFSTAAQHAAVEDRNVVTGSLLRSGKRS